jgi:competence protein ComEC
MTVRVLDVGQGDATLIENGGSLVLIDGGPEEATLGRHLDRLGLNGDTIDIVIITHAHHDHYNGLRELFETRRGIVIRYLFESKDSSANMTLRVLRDSINARVARSELVYRDSDDPCSNGSAICTIFLRGGARLHVLRPFPQGDDPNERSTPVKLVGPDSASFTMWFAGDAEQGAIAWFEKTGYHTSPGMKATVLKGNHHGSCNGVNPRYLELVNPSIVTFSLSAQNAYGHVHQQTLELLSSLGLTWYRTDQNGEITITTPGTPGGGYMVGGEKGEPNMTGLGDRRSNAC